MLARSIATPTAVRCWTRGLGSVLAPARSHVLTLHDQSGAGLPSHHGQLASLAQDTGRTFSCAFPSRVLNFSDRSQRPLYALHIQTASKATLPRDPERPKRPLSAYFRFAAVQREKHGVKKVAQIAEVWKKATSAEKQPFEQAAAKDDVVYRTEFEKYKAAGKLDAWQRDPAKPKRPLTGFMAYAQQERKAPDIAKLRVAEAGKVLGASWAKLPSEKKAPFDAKFKIEKEKYDSAMKAYNASGSEKEWLKRTGRLEVQQKAEAKKQAQKDKIKEAKATKLANDAKAKEKVKATAAKAKAAKANAAAAKAKAATAKVAAAKVVKAKAEKAKAVKAATAKSAREKALKAKAAKAASTKVAREKALKAKADKAAKGKMANQVVAAKALAKAPKEATLKM